MPIKTAGASGMLDNDDIKLGMGDAGQNVLMLRDNTPHGLDPVKKQDAAPSHFNPPKISNPQDGPLFTKRGGPNNNNIEGPPEHNERSSSTAVSTSGRDNVFTAPPSTLADSDGDTPASDKFYHSKAATEDGNQENAENESEYEDIPIGPPLQPEERWHTKRDNSPDRPFIVNIGVVVGQAVTDSVSNTHSFLTTAKDYTLIALKFTLNAVLIALSFLIHSILLPSTQFIFKLLKAIVPQSTDEFAVAIFSIAVLVVGLYIGTAASEEEKSRRFLATRIGIAVAGTVMGGFFEIRKVRLGTGPAEPGRLAMKLALLWAAVLV